MIRAAVVTVADDRGPLRTMQPTANTPPDPSAWTAPAPPPPPSRWRSRWVRIGAIAAVAAGVTGYDIYRDVHDGSDRTVISHSADPADTTCPVPGAQTIIMGKNSADEPTIHIPVRPGWDDIDFRNDPKIDKKVDVSYLRGTIANTGLREHKYTPSVEVILEGGADTGDSVPTILATVFGPLEQTVGTVRKSTETICGETVYRADYGGLKVDDTTSESGTLLVTVTDAHHGGRWVVGVKLATADPDNSEYIAERDALLRGFYVTD